MKKKYTAHTDRFKFKIALEALKGKMTINELCQEFKIAASQIHNWKKKVEEYGPQIFSSKTKSNNHEQEVDRLHTTIGKLKVECDFLAKALGR